MALSTLVNAIDVNAWADTLDAQETLPRLVRRLAEQTNASLRKIHFATDEFTRAKGGDFAVAEEAIAKATTRTGTTKMFKVVGREQAAEDDDRYRFSREICSRGGAR